MSAKLEQYQKITSENVIKQLKDLAEPLKGISVVHVNSTRMGGGVAEILDTMVPLMNELGLETSWEIIEGEPDFYQCTKSFHNGLQGTPVVIPEHLLKNYEKVNAENAERLHDKLNNADIVVIHDPQPAPMLQHFSERKGKWLWRCHIDASHPDRKVWRYLRSFAAEYDASVFSLPDFAQPLPHTQYLVAPSIDPLSEKNKELTDKEVSDIQKQFGIDSSRPMMLQVSRYDRFKDPIGVIQAYQQAKRFTPGLQLVLAGGGATDDPEGEIVLNEVKNAAGQDDDIKILLLPADAHRTINALQRAASVILQKSLKEGFGLTVSEAMWKHKPVIGGNTGGIRLQVHDHHTGFLVNTPEGAALRLRYLLHNREMLSEMGEKAHRFVKENFLMTRHLRDYLTMMYSLLQGKPGRIEL